MHSIIMASKQKMDTPKAKGDGIPPLPENWDRCHAFNNRKRRYCRQMPLPLSTQCFDTKNQLPRYCGNHRQLMDEWLSIHGRDVEDGGENALKRPRPNSQTTSKEGKSKKKDKGKRVPCPIDPSHFIFESAIAKHILVCPAVRQKQEVTSKEYYHEGINLGGFGDIICHPCPTSDSNKDMDLDDAKELAHAILRVFHFLFLSSNGGKCVTGSLDVKSDHCKLSNQQLKNITEREIYDALLEADLSQVEEGTSISKDVRNPELESNQREDKGASTPKNTGRLTQAVRSARVKAGGDRHLRQIASILGHVRQNGLLSTTNKSETHNNPLIVEMGAGRGMTGLIVAGAMGASLSNTDPSAKVNLCLVDMAGSRAKAETRVRTAKSGGKSKDHCLRLDLVDVTRVKCDLAHVDMSKALPSHIRSSSARTVVIAKHLCGAGTDLAIKSLVKFGRKIDGCVMATCCHGLCTWNEYIGRDYFLRLFRGEIGGLSSFGEKEFNLMKRWTAASVLEDIPLNSEGAANSTTADSDTKDEHHNPIGAGEDKGRYPGIFAVVKELDLACGKGLARACQRLIDYGRCEFIRNDLLQADDSSTSKGGFNVSMLHYVPRNVTPQNALIVATRDS